MIGVSLTIHTVALCPTDRGFVRNSNGECVCPPGYGLSLYDDCQPCREEDGLKVDETGRCVCALERGLIIDERGRCICPIEYGYRLTSRGECVRSEKPECERDEHCADWRYCNLESKTCDDPCQRKIYVGNAHIECLPEPRVTSPKECAADDDCSDDRACFNDRCVNPCVSDACGRGALCRTSNHKAVCNCPSGYTMDGNGNCIPRKYHPVVPMGDSCLRRRVWLPSRMPRDQQQSGLLVPKGHDR